MIIKENNNYYRVKLICLAINILLLAGCTSSVQNPSFLNKLPKNKSEADFVTYLNGFNGSYYRSTIGNVKTNGRFYIAIPEYTVGDNVVRERKNMDSTFVIFDTVFKDSNIYRLTVSLFPQESISFNTLANRILNKTIKDFNYQYGDAIQLYRGYKTINGKPALFAVFQQLILAHPNTMKESHSVTQIVYVIDFNSVVANFWITATDKSWIDPVNDSNRLDVVNGTWKPIKNFIHSFVLFH